MTKVSGRWRRITLLAIIVLIGLRAARESAGTLVSALRLRGGAPRTRGYGSGGDVLVVGRTKSFETVAECGGMRRLRQDDARRRGQVEAPPRFGVLEEVDLEPETPDFLTQMWVIGVGANGRASGGGCERSNRRLRGSGPPIT